MHHRWTPLQAYSPKPSIAVNRFLKEGQMSSHRFFTLVITLVWIGIAVTRAMAQEITIAQAVVCKEVVDRMPVGSGDVIPAGTERVFCFTRIVGAQNETEITHNWYYKGALKASGCCRCAPASGEPGVQKRCCRNGRVSGWWKCFPKTAHPWRALFSSFNNDGSVKSPISALRFIPRHCGVH
jgi:hypothetical protein